MGGVVEKVCGEGKNLQFAGVKHADFTGLCRTA